MTIEVEEQKSITPRLLGLLEEFFEEEDRKSYDAFRAMPLNPKTDDVNALKAYAHALGKLHTRLAEYVENNYLTQLMGDRPVMKEGIDI